MAGASFALNSFVTHSFQVRELAGKKSGVCEGTEGECRVDYFTVNENTDQGEIFIFEILYCCVASQLIFICKWHKIIVALFSHYI